MKKRMMSNIVILSLLFVMVAISPSLASKFPGGNQTEMIFSQTEENLNFIPASDTLKPILEQYLNSEELGEIPNVVVEYNVRTGVEEKYTINYEDIKSDVTRLEPYVGNYIKELQEQSSQGDSFLDSLRTSGTLGVEELQRVNDTTIFPYSSVVKVVGTLNETHVAWGSGAMIDANHVLTAGHVVYDKLEGGWRDNVYVIPGKNGTGTSITEEPYGRAYATHMRSTEGWTYFSSMQHDWAVITLDQDIGDETGWLGLIDIPYDHNNYSDRVYTAGYPATIKSGYYMNNNSGIAGYANEYEHQYTFYGEGGQSGSSVWTYQNSNPYVISIFAYGPAPGSGTRITSEKFDLMNLWLTHDAMTEPHTDLEVTGSNNLFADLDYDKIVYPLITGIPIITTVQNHGNVAIEKVILGYYLSVDENITTDDYLIAEKTIRNLDALELRTIDKTIRVTADVPPGYYEIGWILDPDDEIDELFEDNNVYFNGLQLRVVSTFVDQILGNPLWLSLLIVGVVSIIAVPTIIAIVLKKRKK